MRKIHQQLLCLLLSWLSMAQAADTPAAAQGQDPAVLAAYEAWGQQMELLTGEAKVPLALFSNPYYAHLAGSSSSLVALKSSYHMHQDRIMSSRHIPKGAGDTIWCLSIATRFESGPPIGISSIIDLPTNVTVLKITPSGSDYTIHLLNDGQQETFTISPGSLLNWSKATVNSKGHLPKVFGSEYRKWASKSIQRAPPRGAPDL